MDEHRLMAYEFVALISMVLGILLMLLAKR